MYDDMQSTSQYYFYSEIHNRITKRRAMQQNSYNENFHQENYQYVKTTNTNNLSITSNNEYLKNLSQKRIRFSNWISRRKLLATNSVIILYLMCVIFYTPSDASKLLAKFQIESVSAHSIVVRMISTEHVSGAENADDTYGRKLMTSRRKLEMQIILFDLNRLREFRRSELTATLFSFDGLISDTWFAIRINYRILYIKDISDNLNHEDDYGGTLIDFPTKQELVVKTTSENSPPFNVGIKSNSKFIFEEHVVHFEELSTSPNRLNLTVSSVFANRPKIVTLIVPELRCLRGTIKPPAQRVRRQFTTISFDLKRLLNTGSSITALPLFALSTSITPTSIEQYGLKQYNIDHKYNGGTDSLDTLALMGVDLAQVNALQCYQLCIFPFVRAEIRHHGEETFRAKEFCDSVPNAKRFAYYFANQDGDDDNGNRAQQRRQQYLRSTDSKSKFYNSQASSAYSRRIVIFSVIFILILNFKFL